MYMVLPVLQSTRKECRQDSEDYLNSSHYFSFICMGQIYMHFALFLRFTHFENFVINQCSLKIPN